MLRVLDEAAPNANAINADEWTAWEVDDTGIALLESDGIRRYLPLSPILETAGWYQFEPIDPANLSPTSGWGRFVNVSNLVAGRTRYRDEISLLYPPEQVAASSLRDRLEWVWSGTEFTHD